MTRLITRAPLFGACLLLLWFAGCPNWQEMDSRLRIAMARAGYTIPATYVQVTSAEDAERLSFRGSPTVLLDRADPFADASAPVGLSCRVFQTPRDCAALRLSSNCSRC